MFNKVDDDAVYDLTVRTVEMGYGIYYDGKKVFERVLVIPNKEHIAVEFKINSDKMFVGLASHSFV